MRHVEGDGRERLLSVPLRYAPSSAMCVFLASASTPVGADASLSRPAGVALQQGDAATAAAFLVGTRTRTGKGSAPWRQHTRVTNARRVRSLRRAVTSAQSDSSQPSDPTAAAMTVPAAGSRSRTSPVRPLRVAAAGPILMSTPTRAPTSPGSSSSSSSSSNSDTKRRYPSPGRKVAVEQQQQQTRSRDEEHREHAARPALGSQQVQQGLLAEGGLEATQKTPRTWGASTTTTTAKLRAAPEST
ncbi:unnamed protein product, partial [Laminaria digitata]